MAKRKQENLGPPGWSPTRRLIVSLLLLIHLGAIVIAPWSSPPPSPALAQRLQRVFRPYLAAAYLGHGYRFFAPNPGPSHVVRYEMEFPDGERREGRIPDPTTLWPRLIYHRQFMITERLFSGFTLIQPGPPPEYLTDWEKQEWESRNEAARTQVERLARGLARELLREHGGHRVRLTLQEHNLAFPADVQEGMSLNDPRLYFNVTELGPYEKDTP